VIEYLEKTDQAAAKIARERYSCFDRFHCDTQAYGYSTSFGFSKSCEAEVIKQLMDMQRRYTEEYERTGFHTEQDGIFYAKQNALVVKDAEEYYRRMFTQNTWNLRDQHMVRTMKELLDHLGKCYPNVTQKAVVWAHNSHLGDAAFTDSSKRGEINIGYLVRKEFGLDKTFNVGFTTYDGTVTAADDWDEPVKCKPVNPAMPGSYELLLHQVGIPSFLLIFRSNSPNLRVDKDLVEEMKKERLERAIGVIYRPDTERMSHYFHASVSKQFDALMHIDRTSAVKPLDPKQEIDREPETFPTGI